MDNSSNIYLVGMMGAGKSTVGRALAKHLHLSFVDADAEIVERTGVKIPVIFEIEGEAGFRARECAVLQELTQRHGLVLATGGGAVLNAANRELLRQHGIVIYLRVKPEDLLQRTRNDKNRPLLQTQNPLETLRQLYAERDPLYRETAHLIVDTGNQSVARLVNLLVQRLTAFSDDQVS